MHQPPQYLAPLIAGCTALHPLAGHATGVSRDARSVYDAIREVVACHERSAALFGDKESLISQLWSLADECGADDWDGEGALALKDGAIGTAVSFITALPAGLPLPEIAPDPDGEVSLDWIVSKTRMFSLSCGTSSRLAYSWLDGTDKGHAVASFDGWRVPERILQGIRSIIGKDHATLRLA